MWLLRKNCFFFVHLRKYLTLQTPHGKFLILCWMVILPIEFVISKQNKTPKIDPRMLKLVEAGIAILRLVLSFTQVNRAL